MKFLPAGYDTKELERGQSNKWNWKWLSEVDTDGDKWSLWLRKPEISGKAYCECCDKVLNYGSSGKTALRKHSEKYKDHKKNKNTIKRNQVLPGSSKAVEATESMQDRVASVRAVITTFMSEHCLSFTMAEDLLNLAKKLSEDRQALTKTTLSATSATYITTHGVAKAFKEEVKEKIRNKYISLNLDEATNNSYDKVLNVLVQFYDEQENKIQLRHMGSRAQNISTAKDIVKSVEDILEEYEVKWCQVVSVLMDNCSTMRGVRGGVEALIRQKNKDLLDISGDTIHMVNNAAKVLLTSVDDGVQSFCSDIYYDIEQSPKVKHIFQEVQSLLNISGRATHLIRPISSRFLQMKEVTARVVSLLDPLTVYYYSFLTENEKNEYRSVVSQIFNKHKVSEEAQASIVLLQMSQEHQQKSATSSDRKDRILEYIFNKRFEMETKLNLFRGLLETFSGYVKVFQTESPLIHTVHSRMVDLTREFLGMFLKPEHIPERPSQLAKLDVTDRTIQKSDKDLGVGDFAFVAMNKARLDKRCHYWVNDLYASLRNGYVQAGKKMLALPLNNATLRLLTVMDPVFVGHQQTATSFQRLASCIPSFNSNEELMGKLATEVSKYNVDSEVKNLADQYRPADNIDTGFWAKVFALESFSKPRYSAMKSLVTALLTIFSGPLVESSFSIMDDIVEKDRASLTVENYEAVAIVKSTMKKKQLKSHNMKVNHRMKRACVNAYSTYTVHLRRKKELKQQELRRKLDASVLQLKAEKAKRVQKLLVLKKKMLNKQKLGISKRKREEDSASSKKWKRIKF